MATPAQIRSTIDAQLAGIWTKIQARQAVRFANTGNYAQFLWSHTAAPADGVEAAPDGTAKPTNEAAGWQAVLADLLPTMAFRLRIDVYDGPSGKGYVATAQVKFGNQVWERAQNSGPETWRTRGWSRVD